jgi:hypothetical protein
VIDLAALALLTPADGEFFELQNSTGAESDPLITGVPVGLAGAPDLSFRLRYDDPPGEYVFIEYFSTDPEGRYAVKATEGVASAAAADATQALSDAAAAQGDASQALIDSAAAQGDATQALSDAAAAQASADAILTGGSSDKVFFENAQTITTNYTISTNKNAMSTGPISLNSGITVTIPSTSTWVIL